MRSNINNVTNFSKFVTTIVFVSTFRILSCYYTSRSTVWLLHRFFASKLSLFNLSGPSRSFCHFNVRFAADIITGIGGTRRQGFKDFTATSLVIEPLGIKNTIFTNLIHRILLCISDENFSKNPASFETRANCSIICIFIQQIA